MSTNIKQPDITIFRGWKEFGKHVWSPYVVKLEARLRFADVRYSVDVGSPKTAPKGKIPYVECSNLPGTAEDAQGDTLQLSDSTLIIKTLTEVGVIPDINAELSPVDRANDLALRALLEDKLYFYHTWERWILNYYTMRNHVFQALPYSVRIFVGMMVYRGIVATLHGQGTGRYSAEEIAGFRLEIWDAVNSLLVDSKSKSGIDSSSQEPFWVLGRRQPTEADATLFGFIVSVLISTAGPDSKKVVRGFPAILDYAQRIQVRYFQEYESW
ncbi:hypothetical protein TruAng_004409 [Truncatella angustata]|nr:hypothetical protein TruAng_004409 [Truncatella angustata]